MRASLILNEIFFSELPISLEGEGLRLRGLAVRVIRKREASAEAVEAVAETVHQKLCRNSSRSNSRNIRSDSTSCSRSCAEAAVHAAVEAVAEAEEQQEDCILQQVRTKKETVIALHQHN